MILNQLHWPLEALLGVLVIIVTMWLCEQLTLCYLPEHIEGGRYFAASGFGLVSMLHNGVLIRRHSLRSPPTPFWKTCRCLWETHRNTSSEFSSRCQTQHGVLGGAWCTGPS